MSAPISLRSVFRACRPGKTTPISTRATLIQNRTYANAPDTNIRGIPQTKSKEEQKQLLENVPVQEPPKRSAPSRSNLASTSASTTPDATTPLDTSAAISTDTAAEEQDAPVKPLSANVIAAYRAPLKHKAPHGVPVASLQLRSYSVRSLEFFADFALRAAYYLNLPASGPVPLPRRIERWTTLRSNFVHKKAQENFERITYKRLVTIMDGDKTAVEVWLAVLRKWQFYGVGMKANVWEWEGIDVATKMDAQSKELEKDIDAKLANFGWNTAVAGSRTSLEEMLYKQGPKHVGVPMTEVREGSRRAKSEI